MEKTCLASRSLYFWTFDNFSLIRNTKSMGSPCRIWGEDKTTCEALLQEATETEEAYWGQRAALSINESALAQEWRTTLCSVLSMRRSRTRGSRREAKG